MLTSLPSSCAGNPFTSQRGPVFREGTTAPTSQPGSVSTKYVNIATPRHSLSTHQSSPPGMRERGKRIPKPLRCTSSKPTSPSSKNARGGSSSHGRIHDPFVRTSNFAFPLNSMSHAFVNSKNVDRKI